MCNSTIQEPASSVSFLPLSAKVAMPRSISQTLQDSRGSMKEGTEKAERNPVSLFTQRSCSTESCSLSTITSDIIVTTGHQNWEREDLPINKLEDSHKKDW